MFKFNNGFKVVILLSLLHRASWRPLFRSTRSLSLKTFETEYIYTIYPVWQERNRKKTTFISKGKRKRTNQEINWLHKRHEGDDMLTEYEAPKK